MVCESGYQKRGRANDQTRYRYGALFLYGWFRYWDRDRGRKPANLVVAAILIVTALVLLG